MAGYDTWRLSGTDGRAEETSLPRMSRKPKKGYYVKGHFVAEGSELDLELRAEQTGGERSRTELKKERTELQKLGDELLTLRSDLFGRLGLPESLQTALAAATRISTFAAR